LVEVIVGELLPAVDVPGVLAFCDALGVPARRARWENFKPTKLKLRELGTAEDVRRNLGFYRDRIAKAEDGGPFPPFTSRPKVRARRLPAKGQ
jgi:hypothetical protein